MVMFRSSRRDLAPLFETLEDRRLLSFSLKVNFQPPTAPVPAGYVADKGAVYGSQGNGFTYGWDVANTAYPHRETAPFSEPKPGDTHRSTEWQVVTRSTGEVVWRADGLTTVSGKVHVHYGDGQFVGSLAGKSELLPDTDYILRVRHRDS